MLQAGAEERERERRKGGRKYTPICDELEKECLYFCISKKEKDSCHEHPGWRFNSAVSPIRASWALVCVTTAE